MMLLKNAISIVVSDKLAKNNSIQIFYSAADASACLPTTLPPKWRTFLRCVSLYCLGSVGSCCARQYISRPTDGVMSYMMGVSYVTASVYHSLHCAVQTFIICRIAGALDSLFTKCEPAIFFIIITSWHRLQHWRKINDLYTLQPDNVVHDVNMRRATRANKEGGLFTNCFSVVNGRYQ